LSRRSLNSDVTNEAPKEAQVEEDDVLCEWRDEPPALGSVQQCADIMADEEMDASCRFVLDEELKPHLDQEHLSKQHREQQRPEKHRLNQQRRYFNLVDDKEIHELSYTWRSSRTALAEILSPSGKKCKVYINPVNNAKTIVIRSFRIPVRDSSGDSTHIRLDLSPNGLAHVNGFFRQNPSLQADDPARSLGIYSIEDSQWLVDSTAAQSHSLHRVCAGNSIVDWIEGLEYFDTSQLGRRFYIKLWRENGKTRQKYIYNI
jgi:hypothetical protein